MAVGPPPSSRQTAGESLDPDGSASGEDGASAGSEAGAEQALVSAMARGDRQSLGLLYDRFAPEMLALSLRMLGGAREAEDLVHDVFLEAWHRAQHYDPSRGSVRTWLMLRVRSRALDRLRSARRAGLVALDDSLLAERAAPEEEAPARARDARVLHGVLRDLPQEQRTVLELGYFGGYSSAEIASALSIPLGTVKSRMSRAIIALRARMDRPEGGAR